MPMPRRRSLSLSSQFYALEQPPPLNPELLDTHTAQLYLHHHSSTTAHSQLTCPSNPSLSPSLVTHRHASLPRSRPISRSLSSSSTPSSSRRQWKRLLPRPRSATRSRGISFQATSNRISALFALRLSSSIRVRRSSLHQTCSFYDPSHHVYSCRSSTSAAARSAPFGS